MFFSGSFEHFRQKLCYFTWRNRRNPADLLHIRFACSQFLYNLLISGSYLHIIIPVSSKWNAWCTRLFFSYLLLLWAVNEAAFFNANNFWNRPNTGSGNIRFHHKGLRMIFITRRPSDLFNNTNTLSNLNSLVYLALLEHLRVLL